MKNFDKDDAVCFLLITTAKDYSGRKYYAPLAMEGNELRKVCLHSACYSKVALRADCVLSAVKGAKQLISC